MGQKFTVKQNDFSHGMQSETRDKRLVGQSQVFGASKIKHFDIYKNANKLSPNPSFERFNTVAEEDYGIVAVGGDFDSELYGLGKAINNWYSLDFTYKITLTPDSTGSCDYMYVDLSQLSDDFWDNVESDGSDIRASTATNRFAKTKLIDFNSTTKVGTLLVEAITVEDIDLYFGFSDAVDPSEYTGLFNAGTHVYPLDGTDVDFRGGNDLDDGVATYSDGKFGQGLTNSNVDTTNPSSSGDECSLSFFFKLDSNPLSEHTIIKFAQDVIVYVRTDGKLRLFGDMDTGTISLISTTALTTGQWYYVGMNIKENDYANIFLDGVEDTTVPIASRLENNSEVITVNPNADMTIQSVILKRNSVKTDAQCVLEGDMFTDATFWTEGSLVNISSITPAYSGICIYTKDLNGTEWKTDYYTGFPVMDVDTNIYPVPAFIEYDSGYFFLTSTNSDITGLLYGGRAAYFDTVTVTFDAQDTLLGTRGINKPLSSLSFPIDKEWYFNNSGVLDGFTNGIYNVDVFDPFPVINSHTPYGYSLAMTGTRRNQGYIEIWDLTGTDPETVIKTGGGINKIISNTKGQLIVAVDNYIQDDALSRGEPSLDFKLWLGNDNYKTIQSFPFSNVATVYINDWQSTIDSRRADLNNSSVFYAEPDTDWTGFWAIGTGEKTQTIGVSILYDTELIDRPTFNHAVGNNLIVINEDGEIWKLNDDGTYDQTSKFETMIIDAGLAGYKKDISAIEVVLDKDLPVGQTITVSYSVEGGAYETIGTCDGRVTEFTLADGEAFNNFNELQLCIESDGGDASVIEYSIRGEYEQEIT